LPKTEKPEKASPINVRTTFEKILESLVKEQLDKFLENDDIISQPESDFRKKYSCETAIAHSSNLAAILIKKKKRIPFNDLRISSARLLSCRTIKMRMKLSLTQSL